MVAITALQDITTVSNLVLEYHHILTIIAKNRTIELRWLPEHIGIRSNECSRNVRSRTITLAPWNNSRNIVLILRIFPTVGREMKPTYIGESRGQQTDQDHHRGKLGWITDSALREKTQKAKLVQRHKTGRTSNANCQFCGNNVETMEHTMCYCEVLTNTKRLFLETDLIEKLRFKAENIQQMLLSCRKVFEEIFINGKCRGLPRRRRINSLRNIN